MVSFLSSQCGPHLFNIETSISARNAKRKWKELIEHVKLQKQNLNAEDKVWSWLSYMQMQETPEIDDLL